MSGMLPNTLSGSLDAHWYPTILQRTGQLPLNTKVNTFNDESILKPTWKAMQLVIKC